MRTQRRGSYTRVTHLGGLLILLLVVCSALPPSPAATSIDRASGFGAALPDGAWTARFQHAGLGQEGTLSATTTGCRIGLVGSSPSTIALDLIAEQQIDSTRQIRVYAGWPRNAQRQISGVQNQSRGPAPARFSENKLGPTIVWALGGCRQVCVKGIVLHYDMTITRGPDAIVVVRIDRPTADACGQLDACLTPTFRSEPQASVLAYAGAIDQPGCTISAAGDGFRDIAGHHYIIVADDQLDLTFKHRALLLCDREVIGVMDWGYRLTASLGKAADQISPQIREDLVVDLMLKDDPNPIKRARFAQALIAAQEILQLPE